GGGVLERVQRRGRLLCGINGSLPYFSRILEDGVVTGFDADYCRVVATAVFGNHVDRVEFVPLNTTERFDALTSGRVDVLMRNTTWTAGRDIALGVRFGPIIFYDGQKIMVPNSAGIETIADLSHKRICVLPDTTSETNLAEYFAENNISFTPVTSADGRFFQSTRDTVTAYYLLNECDAISGDASQLIALQHSFIPSGVQDHHLIPDVPISKEPLAPVVPEGDEQWYQIVSYAIWATIYAEELTIDQQNVDEYMSSSEPMYKDFLGSNVDESMASLGEFVGIPHNFAYAIIKNVGSYSDIYERNLGDVIPERGLNTIATNGGLLYSPPFRSVRRDLIDVPTHQP
ncbi:MAG: amino acid ABC transporter substrate-binding protein, partial [Chloroflexi bacterium]|nr:amino acid ABC transporter substrate-binding protein [Chloroflexota bacterium]